MSEERTRHRVTFDPKAYLRRLERQGAIAFDDIEFLADELIAAHERADKAETAQRAWTELGAREQAGAAVLRAALEQAMTLLPGGTPDTLDPSEYRVVAACDAALAADAGSALLAELEAARAALEEHTRLSAALVHWIESDGTDGFVDADEDLAALARELKARGP